MLTVILCGISLICIAAAVYAAEPIRKVLIGLAIVLAVFGMISGSTGSRITIGRAGLATPPHVRAGIGIECGRIRVDRLLDGCGGRQVGVVEQAQRFPTRQAQRVEPVG